MTATVLTATVTSHDPEGSTVTYSYQWVKNGTDIPGATGASLDLGVAGNGDRGDAIAVRVVGNDGTLDSAPVTSAPVTVTNTPPTATVSLSPSSPDTNAMLTATATMSDADGDPVTVTYVWKVNGVVRQTTASTSSSTDQFDLSQSGNGDDGDSVTVEVTPNDGIADGAVATATTTVGVPPAGIVLRSSSSGQNGLAGASLTLPAPAGVVSGDVLVAVVDVIAAPSVTAPAGWSLVRTDVTTAANAQTLQAAYVHVAGGSEPSSYTWSLGSKKGAAGAILAYSGVNLRLRSTTAAAWRPRRSRRRSLRRR